MNGEVGILNVGAGDTKISFDPKNPRDRKQASRMVTDMLERGYAIMIEVGKEDGEPIYKRAHKFDSKTCEYIVMGTPNELGPANASSSRKTGSGAKARIEHRVPAEHTRAVSVSRSAGG